MTQATCARHASTPPQRIAAAAFDPTVASADPQCGPLGTTFECGGRIWAVRRTPSFALQGAPRYTVTDLETGHGVWHVHAPNAAAARVLAISAVTMMPLPLPAAPSQRDATPCRHLAPSAHPAPPAASASRHASAC